MERIKFNRELSASGLLRAMILALPLFLNACGKAESTTAGDSQKSIQSETLDANRMEGEKLSVFAPTTAAPQKGNLTRDVERLLDQAGQYADAYKEAASYERLALVNKIIPPLKQAVQLQDSDELRTRLTCDPRFTALAFRPEFRALIDRPKTSAKSLPAKLTIKDPGGLNPTPQATQVAAESVATVNRFSPDAVANVVNTLGDAMAEMAKGMHFDAKVTREVERLLKLVLQKQSGDWKQSLRLLPEDSLETRIAKVHVALSYDQLLSKIVSYRGSFFVACRTTDGGFEIWEFKQPIALSVRSEATNERTRLNTGVLFTSELEFGAAGGNGLFRRYKNGSWSSWNDFPKLPSFTVTKSEHWTVERNTKTPDRTVKYDSFIQPSENTIEGALLRSDESRAISIIEARQTNADELSVQDSLALGRAKLSLGFPNEAARFINLALKNPEIDVHELKVATGLLADWFYCVKPELASDYVTGNLYTYLKESGEVRNSAADDFGEMSPETKKFPQRQTKDHRYGSYSFELIQQLTQAHTVLLEKEQNNPDAQFELSEAFMMHPYFYEKAASLLFEVIGNASPSGRDYKRIVANSTTFVPLLSERTSGSSNFKTILAKGGIDYLKYMTQFQKESVRYQMGY